MSEASTFIRIPRERIGVLIGPGGSVKEQIEKTLGVKLIIDSSTGDVTIELNPENDDPSKLFRAKDVVMAIGRGFSPEKAFRLLEDENVMLDIIDLRQIFGKSESNMKRVRGRIIGREGKTRRIIEELTETYISVYGHTVGIIGSFEHVQIAREAIEMLIRGAMHGTVYRYLHRKRREIKKQMLELWEKPGDFRSNQSMDTS